MTTAADVAAWMQAQLERTGELYQDDAADAIARQFGEDFVRYSERNGNTLIAPAVLKAFNALNADTVVWARRNRYWRLRNQWDDPGRQQDE